MSSAHNLQQTAMLGFVYSHFPCGVDAAALHRMHSFARNDLNYLLLTKRLQCVKDRKKTIVFPCVEDQNIEALKLWREYPN